VNELEKELRVAKIAQLTYTRCIENLDNNLFMHSHKCKTGRLNSVRIYILWIFIAVEYAQYLMGKECCEEYFKQEEGRDKDKRNNT